MESITIGSEKQIKWATDIRAKFHRRLQNKIDEAKMRISYGDLSPEWVEAVTYIVNELIAATERDTKGRAKMWIDGQDRLDGFVARIKEAAEKQYEGGRYVPNGKLLMSK